jgi:hypothetical protein
MPDTSLGLWLVAAVVTALVIVARQWHDDRGTGLVLSYVLTFSVIHLLSPTLYLLPWYDNPHRDVTIVGLGVSAIALMSFFAGSEVLLAILRRREDGEEIPAECATVDQRVIRIYLLAGLVLYGVVLPIAGRVASATALAATGPMILVIGISLLAWNAYYGGRRGLLWTALASTLALPIITVVGQGFLGYGFAAMLTLFAFVASFYRPRWQVVVLSLLFTYLGLSTYVTYMRDRRDIRAVVWAGGAMGARVAQFEETFTAFEWFDPRRPEHLTRIDSRLDQDYFVGAAKLGLDAHQVPFAEGQTFEDAIIALVPRVLWPNKPVVAGSGDLVSSFTGIRFAEGTSVGVGQVMEAYVNFGMPSVVVCFAMLGMVVTLADRRAHYWLAHADAGRFMLWYLPGLSALLIGGSLAEVTSTAAASLIVAAGLKRLVLHTVTGRDLAPDTDSPATPEANA